MPSERYPFSVAPFSVVRHDGEINGQYAAVAENKEWVSLEEAQALAASVDPTDIFPQALAAERLIPQDATDQQALEGFTLLCQTEGIIPALESAHAVHQAVELAATLPRDAIVLVCLSGRGDKDIDIVARALGSEQP